MQLPYLNYTCAIAEPADFAPFAAAIGRTSAGSGLVLRDYATIRADGEHITLGTNVFLGERATVHIVDGLLAATLGNDVTVARFALVHACTVGDGIVVGEGAAVMDGALVGPYAIVAADTIVAPNKQLAGGWIYSGVPAQPLRAASRAECAAAAVSIRAGAPEPLLTSVQLPPLSNESFVAGSDSGGPRCAWQGRSPRVGRAYVAPTAVLIGDVELADDAGIYFGCVISARDATIAIGARTNVQDNSLLVTDAAHGDLIVGKGVTIGHNVQLGAGRIGDDALIGMMSRVADGVEVESGGCIAAGAWVTPGTRVKAGWIWAGRPARAFRELRASEREQFARGRDVYVGYGAAYRGGALISLA